MNRVLQQRTCRVGSAVLGSVMALSTLSACAEDSDAKVGAANDDQAATEASPPPSESSPASSPGTPDARSDYSDCVRDFDKSVFASTPRRWTVLDGEMVAVDGGGVRVWAAGEGGAGTEVTDWQPGYPPPGLSDTEQGMVFTYQATAGDGDSWRVRHLDMTGDPLWDVPIGTDLSIVGVGTDVVALSDRPGESTLHLDVHTGEEVDRPSMTMPEIAEWAPNFRDPGLGNPMKQLYQASPPVPVEYDDPALLDAVAGTEVDVVTYSEGDRTKVAGYRATAAPGDDPIWEVPTERALHHGGLGLCGGVAYVVGDGQLLAVDATAGGKLLSIADVPFDLDSPTTYLEVRAYPGAVGVSNGQHTVVWRTAE